jgi:hypothetical protein
MPIPAPFQEWERLTEKYHALADEPLLAMHSRLDDFTQMAQDVIRKEIRQRKLEPKPEPPQPIPKPKTESDSELPGGLFIDDRWEVIRLAGVVACDCLTEEQIALCGNVLEQENIDFVVTRPREILDRSFPQLLVAAEDLDRARIALAKPIEEATRQQAELDLAVGDYPTILCPSCSTADPLLESVDPGNQWLCESCGNRWSDPTL